MKIRTVTDQHLVVVADVEDGAAAACRWWRAFDAVERVVHQQDAGTAWATDELVRAQKYRIVAVLFPCPHLDFHVRSTDAHRYQDKMLRHQSKRKSSIKLLASEVEAGVGAMAMKQARDGPRVRVNPCDIAAGGEGAKLGASGEVRRP